MGFHLTPGDVSTNAATVVVAGVGAAPGQAVVRVGNVERRIDSWEHARGVTFQRVRIGGLAPGARHRIELTIDGALTAAATVTTLPAALPGPGEKAFTLLLGSCFCGQQDEAGKVARALARVPSGAAPDVQIWCGDQVYLDAPWYRYTAPRSRADLESTFRERYDLTWDATPGGGNLGSAFARAANYFTGDDHELWNNAPNRAPYVANSWTQGGRDEWRAIAGDLYRAFQAERRFDDTLRVGNVSLAVADTRLDRDDDEHRFMTGADLARLTAWLANLPGPGFLVLGQPIFTEPAGFSGHFADWGLPDYDQFAELARALTSVRHSLVVLTGDVHFGRIASAALRSGGELVEIISSPLALVSPLVGGSWKSAPESFPSRPIPGVVQEKVVTEPFQAVEPHFLTLQLTAHGDAVDLAVRHWPIDPHQTPGDTVFTRRLR